jgi:hypothetical protein
MFLENLGGRVHLRDQVLGVSIILKWMLEMWEVRLGTGSIWLWICVNMRLCEHSNGLNQVGSGTVKHNE